MGHRFTIHIVDSDSRARAESAQIVFALGHHAEVYSDLPELLQHAPREGIILAHAPAAPGGAARLVADLSGAGVWLPVILVSASPDVSEVVEAIKAGVLDYMLLPLERDRLSDALKTVVREASARGKAHRKMIEARARIESLSPREREVLDRLVKGFSNKAIAQDLVISPRTVEIHRSKMMDKLDAGHAADAVRLWLEAGIEDEKAPADFRRRAARH